MILLGFEGLIISLFIVSGKVVIDLAISNWILGIIWFFAVTLMTILVHLLYMLYEKYRKEKIDNLGWSDMDKFVARIVPWGVVFGTAIMIVWLIATNQLFWR